MAVGLLEQAEAIAGDPDCSRIDRMAAAQAVHQIRGDLASRTAGCLRR